MVTCTLQIITSSYAENTVYVSVVMIPHTALQLLSGLLPGLNTLSVLLLGLSLGCQDTEMGFFVLNIEKVKDKKNLNSKLHGRV